HWSRGWVVEEAIHYGRCELVEAHVADHERVGGVNLKDGHPDLVLPDGLLTAPGHMRSKVFNRGSFKGRLNPGRYFIYQEYDIYASAKIRRIRHRPRQRRQFPVIVAEEAEVLAADGPQAPDLPAKAVDRVIGIGDPANHVVQIDVAHWIRLILCCRRFRGRAHRAHEMTQGVRTLIEPHCRFRMEHISSYEITAAVAICSPRRGTMTFE